MYVTGYQIPLPIKPVSLTHTLLNHTLTTVMTSPQGITVEIYPGFKAVVAGVSGHHGVHILYFDCY
jgi:hypothetical protein